MSVTPSTAALAGVLALALTARPAAAEPPEGKQAKVCFTCHKTVEPGTIRGHFDECATQASSFQVKVDGEPIVLSFDKASFQVANAPESGDLQKALKSIKKGSEIRVVYALDGSARRASLLVVKPRLEVAAENLVTTEELAALVARGPEQGKYFLFDARPAPRYAEGYIPTAESLPFPAFEKEKARLPADKAALVVFYCSGVT